MRIYLQQFIKNKFLAKYNNVIDSNYSIFQKKLAIIEQERVIFNVEEQGSIRINI